MGSEEARQLGHGGSSSRGPGTVRIGTPPPPARRGMILPISSWSMGPWAPGPLAEGRLAWTAPGWIRGRLAAVVAGGGSCAASPLLRWPSLPFRGSWCWGGCPLPRLVAPVWLRTALPCPFLVGGSPTLGRQCGRVGPPHAT